MEIKKITLAASIITSSLILSACGGGGGDKGGASPGPQEYGKVTVSFTQMSGASVKMTVTNNDQYPTGHIDFGLPDDTSNFSVYDGTSNTSWCTPTTCPDSCDQLTVLQPGQSCYGYVNAKNTVGYTEGSKTQSNGIVINNVAQSLNYNLTDTGLLYSLGNDGTIHYKKASDTNWSTISKPAAVTNVTALNVDHYGIVYIGGDNGHVYQLNEDGATWRDLGNVGITSVMAIAFTSDNSLFAAGAGSGSIFKYQNNSWSVFDSPPSLTEINNMAVQTNDSVFVAGKQGATTKLYKATSAGNWSAVNLPTGPASYNVLGFGFDKNSGDLLMSFATNDNTYRYINNPGIWDSSLNPVVNTQDTNDFYIERGMDNEIIYLATSGNTGQIFKYDNTGSNWQQIAQTGSKITKLSEGSSLSIATSNT
ncbi:WD40/YVTN/BNR-like repeat-containing protein [Cysteiniphilum litorale]|uniref:WD40/YVTN/BNR-like repeat-containing protein n=1 Tax=Cysteiniphilum litorale TaxID=2056700 RepID=UPI003F881998